MRVRSGALRVAAAFLLSGSLLGGAAGLALAQAMTYNVVLRSFAIEGAPASVRAGQQLRFNVTNPGPTGNHNLSIDGMGVSIASPDPNVAPATNGVVNLTAPAAPGTYALFCPVGQHRKMGMEVTLTVLAGATGLAAAGAAAGVPAPSFWLAGAGLAAGAAGLFLRRRGA
jgi:plastocyanin